MSGHAGARRRTHPSLYKDICHPVTAQILNLVTLPVGSGCFQAAATERQKSEVGISLKTLEDGGGYGGLQLEVKEGMFSSFHFSPEISTDMLVSKAGILPLFFHRSNKFMLCSLMTNRGRRVKSTTHSGQFCLSAC